MDDILETETTESLRHYTYAAAMKRSVDNLEIAMLGAGLRRKKKTEDVVEIRLIHLMSHRIDTATFVGNLETYH